MEVKLASYLSICGMFCSDTVFALRDCISPTAEFNRKYSGVYAVLSF